MKSSNLVKYILDTNILMKFEKWIPIEVNSFFWEKMEETLLLGKWVLLDVVVNEIKWEKNLFNWCKKQKEKGLTTKISDEDRNRGVEINNLYNMIDQNTGKSTTDTYIIAHAEANGLGVFSDEMFKDKDKIFNKIPDVCNALKVKNIRKPILFFRNIGFKN